MECTCRTQLLKSFPEDTTQATDILLHKHFPVDTFHNFYLCHCQQWSNFQRSKFHPQIRWSTPADRIFQQDTGYKKRFSPNLSKKNYPLSKFHFRIHCRTLADRNAPQDKAGKMKHPLHP
jgi:hypothetical protein